MQSPAEFRTKFRVEALALHRGGGWTVSLRPAQCTLGACVLSLDRACTSLGDLEAGEADGLAAAARWFEAAARRTFGPDKFNHLALMMVDEQLHLHALPRYAAEQHFADVRWTDPGWPKVPDLAHVHPADDALLARVADAMRA